MALSLQQAKDEYHAAQHQLREALVRVQTHRIDMTMTSETPDIAPEISWLLETGRHKAVRHIMLLLEDHASACANLRYASIHHLAPEYEAVVNPGDVPDYLTEPEPEPAPAPAPASAPEPS